MKSRLLVNGLDPARGLIVTDDQNPTFSYRAAQEGIRATHCTVEVHGCWHSGRLPLQSPHIQYGGKPLAPKTEYKVMVTLLCDGEAVDEVTASFETGFLGSAWQAGWVEPVQDVALPEKAIQFHELFMPDTDDGQVVRRMRPCPLLRKTFVCKGNPARARLYASAHGLYEVVVNGKRVGSRFLAPETSPYPKRLYYQAYDIAKLLTAGENTMEVLLADGWWAGRIGISGDSCQYGDRLGFIAQLEMTMADGQGSMVLSDESFACTRSYIDYADLFVGERHDYTTAEPVWSQCASADYGTDNLVAQPIAPVTAWRELAPVRFVTTPRGELVADFGQVVAGVVRLSLDLLDEATVTLDFCEVLDKEGNYFRNIIGRNKNQQDVAICPAGKTVFCPKFTYHGFRYVRISGIAQEWITGMVAVAMGTELEPCGSFHCSNEELNRLQGNIRWSTRSNMLSVPTDCPQREKMGWTGDIQVFTRTAAFNYDVSNFLCGWLDNVRVEQTPDGEIPCVVPCYPAQDRMERDKSGYNSSPAWGDACILVPLYLYQMVGDKRVLRDNLPMMRRWLGFIEATAATKPGIWETLTEAQKARNPYLWTKGHQFGDWLIPSLRATGHAGVTAGMEATYRVVGSCFYAVTVRAFIEVLQALEGGHEKELEEYRNLLVKIRQAVREEYIAEDGRIEGDLQGLYVMALYAGIGDGILREKLAEHLVRLIQDSGWRLDTGFVSTPYLLDTLVDTGHRDVALRLFFQTECPSWLYQVRKGATTIWENWAAISPDGEVTASSFNHCALGCVGDWLYRHIGGIAPQAPGYRSVRLAPLFEAPLESAEAIHDCPYGRITSRWRKENGRVHYEIILPKGTGGRVRLPVQAVGALVCEGPGPQETVTAENALELVFGSGRHGFTFPDESAVKGI